MPSFKRQLTCAFLFFSLIVGSGFSTQVLAVDVIAHPSVTITSLSHKQLRRIYTLRQRQWPDGRSIKVFVFKRENPIHGQFTQKALNMFPYQLEQIWNKLTYSGAGVRPIEVKTYAEMIEQIQSSPGAIGYVAELGQNSKGVKFVQIRGR